MYYILRLNNNKNDRVDRIDALSKKEAKSFFMGRKQMNEQTFNHLYHIEKEKSS